ncbi:MAG: acyl-CoA thioesterase [Acidimicrobiia bacterium]
MPSGFARVLDLERVAKSHFRSPADPDSGTHLYGGLVATQALWAAATDIDPVYEPHSLQCSFLKAGRTDLPLDYHVEVLLDGRSFVNRRVDTRQEGALIFTATISFQRHEEGPDLQLPVVPGVAGPDFTGDPGGPFGVEGPFTWAREFEYVSVPSDPPDTERSPRTTMRYWVRSVGPLNDDPLASACALTFASDMRAAGSAAEGVYRFIEGGVRVATVNHSIWFHRNAPPGEWMLVQNRAVSNGKNRGLVAGTIHHGDGTHLASYGQEVLVRKPL